MGDGQSNVASVSVTADGPAAVGFVGDEPVGLGVGPTGTRPVELHRAIKGRRAHRAGGRQSALGPAACPCHRCAGAPWC